MAHFAQLTGLLGNRFFIVYCVAYLRSMSKKADGHHELSIKKYYIEFCYFFLSFYHCFILFFLSYVGQHGQKVPGLWGYPEFYFRSRLFLVLVVILLVFFVFSPCSVSPQFPPKAKSSNKVTLSAFVQTPTAPASLNVSSST